MYIHPDPVVEAWRQWARRAIGSFEFITDPGLEAQEYASQYSQGCYYCRMDNYSHTTCGVLDGMKCRAAIDHQQLELRQQGAGGAGRRPPPPPPAQHRPQSQGPLMPPPQQENPQGQQQGMARCT
eukprot:14646662-Ditylum_brightwellii.AAC.1